MCEFRLSAFEFLEVDMKCKPNRSRDIIINECAMLFFRLLLHFTKMHKQLHLEIGGKSSETAHCIPSIFVCCANVLKRCLSGYMCDKFNFSLRNGIMFCRYLIRNQNNGNKLSKYKYIYICVRKLCACYVHSTSCNVIRS